jgi:hypothetical protein
MTRILKKVSRWRIICLLLVVVLVQQSIFYINVLHKIHLIPIRRIEALSESQHRFDTDNSSTSMSNTHFALNIGTNYSDVLTLKRIIDRRPRRVDKCKTFTFFAVDWTLYRRSSFDASLESRRCRMLHRRIFQGW